MGGFSWTMILAPLVMGGTMAIFFNPRFALFCLLSPVLMLFNLIDNRFSRRRGLRAREQTFQPDLIEFEKELSAVDGGVADAGSGSATHRYPISSLRPSAATPGSGSGDRTTRTS